MNYNPLNFDYYDMDNLDNREVDTDIDLYSPEEGFTKGTIFKTLYIPYKNYTPSNISPKTEKDILMYQIMIYTATVHDLTLYLDVYPNDIEAVNLRKIYQKKCKELEDTYSSKYPPFTLTAESINKTPFSWSTTQFPWEVKQ